MVETANGLALTENGRRNDAIVTGHAQESEATRPRQDRRGSSFERKVATISGDPHQRRDASPQYDGKVPAMRTERMLGGSSLRER